MGMVVSRGREEGEAGKLPAATGVALCDTSDEERCERDPESEPGCSIQPVSHDLHGISERPTDSSL